MVYVVLIVLSLALFAGFLALTAREGRTGVRMLAPVRDRFDAQVHDYTKLLGRVDIGSLLFHFLRDAGKTVVHDVAHVSLALVEALQGALRHLVVRLRGNTPLHRGNPGAFVEYMSKGTRVTRAHRENGPATESAVPQEGNGAV